MIDSHCHLTDERILTQLDDVLTRCAAHGVHEQVTIATTPSDGVDARALADRHESVWFTVGIHPNESGAFAPADVGRLREFAAHPKCVALGEMGLDFHWKDVPVAHQESMFRRQLELATELEMPVVIHSRESVAASLAILREYAGVRCVFHCFTGTPEEAKAIAAAGYLIGFTGALTFKKNDGLRRAAALLPWNQILIETDAPYMTPEPHRGVKVNDPSYVRFVLKVLADARRITLEEADRITTFNTKMFYRMPGAQLNP